MPVDLSFPAPLSTADLVNSVPLTVVFGPIADKAVKKKSYLGRDSKSNFIIIPKAGFSCVAENR